MKSKEWKDIPHRDADFESRVYIGTLLSFIVVRKPPAMPGVFVLQ